MATLQIHKEIKDKLDYYTQISKIPNIIFHGPSGSGKHTIVNDFVKKIYNNDRISIRSLVCFVNCAHGKGIKFIREELKFFAKTHINSNDGNNFKSIILSNADKLTMDAQSALRRCIELFSHNTRFFIIVEDKYKLLKPILSRFCEVYVPEPMINGKETNLYKHNINELFKIDNTDKVDWIKKEVNKWTKLENDKVANLPDLAIKIYEKGCSALDLMKWIEQPKFAAVTLEKKSELLLAFHKVRREFRSEQMLITFILNFVFLSSDASLENISFM